MHAPRKEPGLRRPDSQARDRGAVSCCGEWRLIKDDTAALRRWVCAVWAGAEAHDYKAANDRRILDRFGTKGQDLTC
jgi:hypothetical protein